MKALVLDAANEAAATQGTSPTPSPARVKPSSPSKPPRSTTATSGFRKGQYAGFEISPSPPVPTAAGAWKRCGEGVEIPPGQGKRGHHQPRPRLGRPVTAAQSDQFRILGLPDDGTFAEKVRVPASALVAKPAHLDAPSTPPRCHLAGADRLPRAVQSARACGPGERVLVNGVGGGVALFALQFAVAAGNTVFVTSGSDGKNPARDGTRRVRRVSATTGRELGQTAQGRGRAAASMSSSTARVARVSPACIDVANCPADASRCSGRRAAIRPASTCAGCSGSNFPF